MHKHTHGRKHDTNTYKWDFARIGDPNIVPEIVGSIRTPKIRYPEFSETPKWSYCLRAWGLGYLYACQEVTSSCKDAGSLGFRVWEFRVEGLGMLSPCVST